MKRRTRIVLVTFFLTALAVILIANFSLGDKQVDRKVDKLYNVEDAQFRRVMASLLGPQLLEGNRVTTLVNGDQIFPAMLEAIRGAQRTITLETYIYWSGDVERQFTAALSERARAGVKVHLILDWLGSFKAEDDVIDSLKAAGVDVQLYNAPRWYTLARFNNRTHRKLLIVDGRVGFTGGVGIADEWAGNAQDPDHWRDTQFKVEGPAVAQMQSAFVENWIDITGDVLHGEAYFPPLEPAGKALAQVFVSSPGGGAEVMQLMYMLSIAAAKKSIRLSASYFIPDDVGIKTFVDALKRGVKVQIILPGPYQDVKIVGAASKDEWGELLRHGAEIYEYQPTMFHTKVVVVDDLWTSVGSTNFNSRSFSVDDEANLNVYDAEFAAINTRIFEDDLKKSRRYTLEEWQARPLHRKIIEKTLGVFSSQL
jgi:cardiolipin synthase A/B